MFPIQHAECGVMCRGPTDCPEPYKICESWLLLVPRGHHSLHCNSLLAAVLTVR